MTVIIGIDPHKATHTAVAIDGDEQPLARLQVAADRSTRPHGCWRGRHRWARTGRGRSSPPTGSGKLLSQQLLAAGEHVVDVPPTLSARVRLLGLDEGGEERRQRRVVDRDRRAAPLRAAGGAPRGSHHGVPAAGRPLRRPHRVAHPGRLPAACRRCGSSSPVAHPDGCPPIGPPSCCAASAPTVGRRGRTQTPRRRAARRCPPPRSRHRHRPSTGSPTPSPRQATSLLEVHGVGPIVAAFILGHVGDPARFPTPDRFASYNGTAPIEASSGPRKRHRLNPRGNRKLNHAMHLVAVTQIAPRHPRPRLLRPQDRRRQDQERSAARA